MDAQVADITDNGVKDTMRVELSAEIAAFLLEMLNSVQLPVSVPNFEQQATLIVQAKRELGG